MKILLFGKNGRVGWELQRALAPLGELVAVGREGLDATPADLARPETLAPVVRAVSPQVIVNAAAYTAVDRAEAEPALAHAVNAEAVGVLAEEAAARGAWLLHFSTDYVFDGSGSQPWREDAAAAPLNVYGRSKLQGEQAIRASGSRHLILRTGWVYAARRASFAQRILEQAAQREQIDVVDDQIGAPTGAELLADIAAHALRQCLRDGGEAGTYHVVAGGETSWHGVACHVVDAARRAGATLRLDATGVRPVPSAAWPAAARRPLNTRLDTRKLQAAFGLRLPAWRVGVERMLAETLHVRGDRH